jgi:hypothetical protein
LSHPKSNKNKNEKVLGQFLSTKFPYKILDKL